MQGSSRSASHSSSEFEFSIGSELLAQTLIKAFGLQTRSLIHPHCTNCKASSELNFSVYFSGARRTRKYSARKSTGKHVPKRSSFNALALLVQRIDLFKPKFNTHRKHISSRRGTSPQRPRMCFRDNRSNLSPCFVIWEVLVRKMFCSAFRFLSSDDMASSSFSIFELPGGMLIRQGYWAQSEQ